MKKAQDGVLEFLLVNHPLDCPVCDKGGECPLQDQTLAYGPGESRFVEEKRHFEKPIAISELVLLDRERCIQCARCTRFAEEVAGEAQIDFAGRGEQVEVATFPDQPFSSYFSGNTVQICPVGALTATPYRFTARPWDLDQVESTCTTCALGCRVAVQSSANRLTRLLGHRLRPGQPGLAVRQGPLRLRVGQRRRAAPTGRPTAPSRHLGGAGRAVRRRGPPRPAGRPSAAHRAAGPQGRRARSRSAGARRWPRRPAGLAAGRAAGGPARSPCIGGARCTNEGAYAWAKLAKGVLGTDSVDAQLGDGLPAELVLSLPRATIDEACSARAVVLLTGDVREELPVLFLRLRAGRPRRQTDADRAGHRGRRRSPATPRSRLPLRPGDAPAVARALAGDRRARPAAVHPEGPSCAPDDLDRGPRGCSARRRRADGAGVVVVLGRPSLAEDGGVAAEAARLLAAAWPAAHFLPALRRGNVHGALDMGLAPGLLPGPGVARARAGEWFTDALGLGARGPGPRRDGGPRLAGRRVDGGAGATGSGAGRCSAPTRSTTSPTAHLAARALGRRPSSWWRSPATVGRPSTRPTWCCRPPWPTSGRAPPPTSRAGSAGWARSWSPRAWPGPTG